MNAKCEHCELKYEMEPGFFQGAMYVSYALGVALSVFVFLTFFLVIGFDPLWFFIVNTLALVFFAPFLFRFARAIYLNIFVHYDNNTSQD
jgi:ABC-type proline/glycine betaine transport system permease subunit